MKIALVCSSGGHLAQLHALDRWWRGHDRFWVTFDTPDARARLRGEHVIYGHHPTTRNLPNLLRNSWLAGSVIRRERPDLIVSNGAGIAIPFLLAGRAMGIATVFVEVVDRVEIPSLTGRVVAPIVDRVVVQQEAQLVHYPDGIVLGPIY